ncbi:MAG TPA: hypothetical protein DDX11_00145 [Candidatus Peribacter riflensis]|uniref:UDP-N-acetylglucosamine--N-acetylmuramyl-(pentapeptide) pyrophosphoryl-undecaprenol N-acetylglucosamine transferase n=1 Tax=Candidatus Peribacter riflensis TaxID=1735162 RepID=A0A0S1SS92_9BACT|nr:MAG: UDP-N-acetylglucosamine--N-acetylmuramyl- (pentapeptide) pyrophosphoryl-UDP N-acetylglucosamine transferase [Candidatus Peribacter riflensis]OGJ78457.1 MAG: hypothetical protein A2398_02320 [Candidatus Peribacteria bacterium RIFOXYB1_FULL_57_12]ALM11458.1 MAG: UDP-N-acetylglucosamine--N-acetylmuramyl- (pentapeptide) pyrophosphoryl-UDP N-acetylglucosamine transferase [Candidatus Peribacter riflensis]ALM12560.1 MAG: UDP-N-acetylglucosamine--N-acetylmuramyl- (pentapeptide) pyrophosphoryl-UD
MTSITVLFVGGGSIGHIAPAVAVARELSAIRPAVTIRFVVSERAEDAEFLEQSGYAVLRLPAQKISWRLPWDFWKAVRAAHALLDETKPRAIFSKGGFVSVPLCFAARKRNIPVILHESDAVSGWANWLTGRWAQAICLGSEGAFRNSKAIVTGNPVRAMVTSGSRQKGLALTGLSRMRPVLLVLGGSQGALALNRAVAAHLTELLDFCDIIHITGQGKATVLQNPPGYWQCPFAGEELPHLYAAADLALSRAGAGALAELAAIGLPTMLVPLDHVAHDHQRRNAEVAVRSGGAILLDQRFLKSSLVPTIRHLIDAAETRRTMGNAIRSLHRPEAARQIAEVIARSLA